MSAVMTPRVVGLQFVNPAGPPRSTVVHPESIGMLSSFIDQEYNRADRDLNGKLDLKEFTAIYATFVNLTKK